MPGSPEVVLKIAHALAARTRAGLPNFADGSDAQSRAIAEQVVGRQNLIGAGLS